jgi:hypothetical protein
MKFQITTLLVIFFLSTAKSQVEIRENTTPIPEIENDFLTSKDTVKLNEILISKRKLSSEDQKAFLLLKARVYKVYPYAVLAAQNLTKLNQGMEKLNTPKDKKKYLKMVESYLSDEFEEKLRKLSRKQGQILVKLIHRQTGESTYALIKSLKSGWKAFWANNTASLFDINLKREYNPYEINEDYLIESILDNAFDTHRLQKQPPAFHIDILELDKLWQDKAKAMGI